MSGQAPRAFDLDAVVEDAYMNIVQNAIVTVKHSVGDNFMKSFRRITYRLQPSFSDHFDALNQITRLLHSIANLPV